MNIDPVTLPGLQRPAGGSSDARRASPPAPAAAAEAAPGIESMRRAAQAANRALAEKGRELTFEFDDEAGRVIVRLIDSNTGEVLRQVPSAELIEIARALDAEAAAGALLRADA